jgi:hypothetical protein
MMHRLRSIDPLVIFLVLGAALAGLHALTRSPEADSPERRIVVTDADVAWIVEGFARRRMRPPTRAELEALVDRHIKDEVLYREAVALGFDREDAALRRRIASKLEFLARDAGAAAEPTEAELQAFLDARAERYAEAPRRRFVQVYVSEERRGERAASDARALLAKLRAESELDPTQVGDTILVEAAQPLSTAAEVSGRFGGSFAEGLFALEVGSWGGPIRSGFGLHLVRVLEEEPGRAARLERVRERVRNDLSQQRKEEALDAYLATLLEKYEVEVRVALLAGEPSGR